MSAIAFLLTMADREWQTTDTKTAPKHKPQTNAGQATNVCVLPLPRGPVHGHVHMDDGRTPKWTGSFFQTVPVCRVVSRVIRGSDPGGRVVLCGWWVRGRYGHSIWKDEDPANEERGQDPTLEGASAPPPSGWRTHGGECDHSFANIPQERRRETTSTAQTPSAHPHL